MRVHTSGAKKQRPGGTSRGDTAAARLRLLGLHLFPRALLCQMLGLEQVTEVLSLSEPCWEIGLLRAGWESQKDHTGEMDGAGGGHRQGDPEGGGQGWAQGTGRETQAALGWGLHEPPHRVTMQPLEQPGRWGRFLEEEIGAAWWVMCQLVSQGTPTWL